ncbi:MAG: hypothetical protein HRK26_04680 [Rickettsiaceae bacterium H1]|nr:hypothetical protein [Rickettsiaceae bacterium H1]
MKKIFNVNAKTNKGVTALMRALRNGHTVTTSAPPELINSFVLAALSLLAYALTSAFFSINLLTTPICPLYAAKAILPSSSDSLTRAFSCNSFSIAFFLLFFLINYKKNS